MPNSKIFCAIPWFELNINQDGSYDLCGCQNDKIVGTSLGKIYNIKNITIEDYWNSERLRNSRLTKLGDVADSMCNMCQEKDRIGYDSTRAKELKKSVIFVDNFERSYQQSPNKHHFDYSQENQGHTTTWPRSLHINLRATCNFACRMCSPHFSTRLQNEYKQLAWIIQDEKFDHWSDDPVGWSNFVNFLEKYIDHIHVIHVIGGEVAFIPKFKFLLDFFADRGRAPAVNFSFTTNGSSTYEEYFESLEQYKRVEIGISIESTGLMGDYIRQGGRVQEILNNIQRLNSIKPDNTDLVIRTVPSLLSLPDYHNLIEWAWNIGIPIYNSLLVRPLWQRAILLPDQIKQRVASDISKFLNQLPDIKGNDFKNQKDPNRIAVTMRNECESIINLASLPAPADADQHRKICAEKLNQWDQLKQINLKDYSVELYEFLKEYGYHGS